MVRAGCQRHSHNGGLDHVPPVQVTLAFMNAYIEPAFRRIEGVKRELWGTPDKQVWLKWIKMNVVTT